MIQGPVTALPHTAGHYDRMTPMERSFVSHGRSIATLAAIVVALAGCATVQKPKPRTVGETIGSGIDKAIIWTSKGIRTILNRENGS